MGAVHTWGQVCIVASGSVVPLCVVAQHTVHDTNSLLGRWQANVVLKLCTLP